MQAGATLQEVRVPALLVAMARSCLFFALALQLVFPQVRNEPERAVPHRLSALPLSKFYDPPVPLPAGKPGDLIRSEASDEYDLPRVQAVRILYHSRSAAGQDVAVSGVVLYPDGKPPAGGWPVIAWAHPRNGVARECAPSLARNVMSGSFLSMYVNLGYAVVATDYQGLGASGRNAFLDAESNATDVIHSLPASRAAVAQLGPRWIAVGYGMGGPAVVRLAEMEGEIRDPNYLGSIAISGLEDLVERYMSSGTSAAFDMPLFLAYGIKTVYPEFEPKDILTEKALPLYPRVGQSCSEPTAESKWPPSELLKPNWASNKFVGPYFRRSSLGHTPAKAPILVISAELDPSAPIAWSTQTVSQMCRLGDTVQFERFPRSATSDVLGDSIPDQIAWLQSRFQGKRLPGNCSGQQ